jgi:hypothetical protein
MVIAIRKLMVKFLVIVVFIALAGLALWLLKCGPGAR